ncbi:uncharacterized protein LOC110852535 isoform X2 [Folsomia candida]|nr:uncharacterized protein LOC110852535 isoform X2 [Folsomia candida]
MNSLETSSQMGSSPPISSSSSSAYTSCDDLSPRIETIGFSTLMVAYDTTANFPSCKSQKFKAHINWMKPLPESGRMMRCTSPTFINIESKIHETSRILNNVHRYFMQQICLRETQNINIANNSESIYYSSLLHNELKKEERYQLSPSTKNKNPINSVMRGKVVDWISGASSNFKYSTDTVYIAVHLMDAFLHGQAIKTTCWSLLGLTVFHLAGKMEEKNRARLSSIWKKYKSLTKYPKSEVLWMELNILVKLKFHVNTTTPKLFVDLAFNSGCISFPCAESERIIKEMSYAIILSSLQCYELSFVKSSYKAELAIQIATEYVMFYRAIFLKQKKAQHTEDLEIMRNSVKICYSLFRTILLQPPSPMDNYSLSEVHKLKEFRGV